MTLRNNAIRRLLVPKWFIYVNHNNNVKRVMKYNNDANGQVTNNNIDSTLCFPKHLFNVPYTKEQQV